MQVHHSGYYQWLTHPISKREQENKKLIIHIKELFKECNGIYGYRNIQKDLIASGTKHKAYPNYLQQCFISNSPDKSWVSDITYIRTHEGWLYLATVIDLFSRKIIDWATSNRMTTPLVLNAIKIAVQRIKKSNTKVILHSDQGSQYSSYDYKIFANTHNITPSMSRRGNCYDNAVAESFFKTLKKELVRKQVFLTREIAASKIFEYIEMFYNSKRRHSYLGFISPTEFEKRYNENVNK